MPTDRPYDVYADEEPTEIHADDCEQTPDSFPTGDATATVVTEPDRFAEDGETFDVDCRCLDDVLNRDRTEADD